MAKIGEGDPRWIVNDRKDGVNVNAWHWEERDLSEYAHQTITKSLSHQKFLENVDGINYIEVEEVNTCTGDVTVAQRKGKIMLYFEIKLTATWVAKLSDESEVRGKMEVLEVDHDEYMNDFEIAVSCQEKGEKACKIEDLVRSKGRTAVREAVRTFFKKICTDYHIGEILKGTTTMPPPPITSAASNPQKGSQDSNKNSGSTSSSSINWSIRWQAPDSELFKAFTDEKRISMYTRRAASVVASNGGQFQFLGGLITGYFVEVKDPVLLKSQWRLSSWEKGVHSSVVITFTKEEPGVTLMEFAQSGVPTDQLESVKEGWRVNFFEPIKLVFGYSLSYL